MAFVNESQRTGPYHGKSETGSIGPGQYHNEGKNHKELMSNLYPKKNAPFNTKVRRDFASMRKFIFVILTMTVTTWFAETIQDTPGPGQYEIKGDFESSIYLRSMDEKGTYLSQDNGHLNMKKQLYSKADKNLSSLRSIQH